MQPPALGQVAHSFDGIRGGPPFARKKAKDAAPWLPGGLLSQGWATRSLLFAGPGLEDLVFPLLSFFGAGSSGAESSFE